MAVRAKQAEQGRVRTGRVGAQAGGGVGPPTPIFQIDLTPGSLPSQTTFSRTSPATDGLYTDAPGSSYNTFSTNVPVFSPAGFYKFQARTQYLANPAAPVTQTTASLATGSYTLWAIGTGAVAASAGTGAATGLGTHTPGVPLVFTVTTAGTFVVTVSGSINRFQLENGSVPTPFIPGTSRAADNLTGIPISLPSSGCVIAEWNYTADATTDRIWCLDSNQPGWADQGPVAPNGGVSTHAQSAGVNRSVLTWDAASFSTAMNSAQDYDSYALATGAKTTLWIGGFANVTGFGQANAILRKFTVYNTRFATSAARALSTTTDYLIVGAGDSITLGGGVTTPYINRIANLITANQGKTAAVLNYGINGISWNYAWASSGHANTLIQDGPVIEAPIIAAPTSASLNKILIGFAGTNGLNPGLGNHTAVVEGSDFVTWLTARLAEGWQASQIVVPTMLPRTGQTDTIRQAYNATLVSNATVYGYRLARLDLDQTIGQAGQYSNTTYYQADGTHPTDAGAAIVAQIIYSALFP